MLHRGTAYLQPYKVAPTSSSVADNRTCHITVDMKWMASLGRVGSFNLGSGGRRAPSSVER